MKHKALAVGLGILGSLVIGELGIRIFRNQLFSHSNLILRDFRINRIRKGTFYDPELGWALSQKFAKTERNLVHHRINEKDYRFFFTSFIDGFRATPNSWKANIDQNNFIFTLGDSFTFGGEVNDEETWPTHLQAILKRRVINGGVSLYGLDQSFIQLKRVLKTNKPKLIILSVIEENIARTNRKKRQSSVTGEWVDKPYYVKRGASIEIGNAPIQVPVGEPSLDWGRNILGRSHLMDFFLSRTAFNFWYGMYWGRKIPPEFLTGEEPTDISCFILKDIQELAKKNDFTPVILGQYYWQDPEKAFKNSPLTHAVLNCSRNLGMLTLDLEPDLKSLAEKSPDEYNTLYFPGAHMTNRGNLWVARKIADFLR